MGSSLPWSLEHILFDNWGYFWLGDASYSWDSNSWVIEGSFSGPNPAALWKTGGSYQVNLNKGDAIPFTYLWANGGGPGGSNLSVKTPSGKVIPGFQGFV
ncbi:hypothetical protein FOTG_19056, partial [Fusarium oxysporum f. sp. vasinfectum 25433]